VATGFAVKKVQQAFPDVIALRKIDEQTWQEVKIELEKESPAQRSAMRSRKIPTLFLTQGCRRSFYNVEPTRNIPSPQYNHAAVAFAPTPRCAGEESVSRPQLFIVIGSE
jgi:hypothetical protein